MRIVLHILLKDLRRHWREIALYVVCCAGWAWVNAHPEGWVWQHQREALPVAMFGMWIFLTIRVVHGECLVGDREFWQSRPYTWGQLLAAKALFLALCLNGPLLIIQVALLIWAGVPLTLALIPGLLFLQLEFFFFATFPTWVLAAVTESLVQWVIAVVGLFLYALFLSSLPWDLLPRTLAGEEDVASWLGGAVIVPVLLFALLWQYGRRRVGLARLAIAIVALLVPVIILIAPSRLVRSIAYQQLTGPAPFRFALRPAADGGGQEYFRTPGLFGDDTIRIPISFGSTDSDSIVRLEGYRMVLTGDNGWRWQSPWLNQWLNTANLRSGSIGFDMPSHLADELSRVHAAATVELAYKMHRLGHSQKIDTSPSKFSIQNVAYCHWFSGNSARFSMGDVTCVAPLRLPGILVTQIDSGETTCPASAGEPPVPANHYASDWNNGTDIVPADFDPNPIHQVSIGFGDWVPPVVSTVNPKQNRKGSLCPGTPLFVRIGTFAGRMRTSINLGPLGIEKPGTVEVNGEIHFEPKDE